MPLLRTKSVKDLRDLVSTSDNKSDTSPKLNLVEKKFDFKKFIHTNIDKHTKNINSRVNNKTYGIIVVLLHGPNSKLVDQVIKNCL